MSELTLGRAKVSFCSENGVVWRAGVGLPVDLVARIRGREALSLIGWVPLTFFSSPHPLPHILLLTIFSLYLVNHFLTHLLACI